MRALLACCLLALAGCRTGSLGHCNSDSDCPSGATCDPSAKVCAVPVVGCFPACAAGFSCVGSGCVDDQPPAIQIAVDTVAYARLLADGGPDLIPVQVTIVDGSGVCDAGACAPQLDAGSPNFFSYSVQEGGVFTFNLPATLAPAGTEGNLGFVVTAQDSLGHRGSAAGARFVDDRPPGISLKLWRNGDGEPPDTGVTVPAFVDNTGYNGTQFIYSDTIHVKGSVNDDGGLSAVTWRIDGIDLDGGISTGASHAICTPGQTSCAVDFTLQLNAPGNGAFHTGDTVTPGPGSTNIPTGTLNVVVTAVDSARTGTGEANVNAASPISPIPATRFLWLQEIGSLVNGFALHPNGNLIVTTGSTTSNAIHSVNPAGVIAQDGGIGWRFGVDAGSNKHFGPVLDMPAIGAGTAATAVIYAASNTGNVVALAPDGGVLWLKTGLQPLTTAPAVAQVSVNGTPVEEVVLPSDPDGGSTWFLYGVYAPDGAAPVATSVATDGVDLFSAPLLLNGHVYFGTSNTVTRADLLDGGFTNLVHGAGGGPFWSLTTDGGVIYAATKTPPDTGGTLTSFSESNLTGNSVFIDGGFNDDFVVDMNGQVLAAAKKQNADGAWDVTQIDPSSGGITVLGSSDNVGHALLQGANGTLFVPREITFLYALIDRKLSWSFDPPNAPNTSIFHAATIDCAGRVYVASGTVVYSLISDDPGLADAPWPNYRRDTRATGNFGMARYGVRLPGPDGGVCDP